MPTFPVRANRFILFIFPAMFLLQGCQTAVLAPPRYAVDESRLSPSPPAPVVLDAASAESPADTHPVVLDPVRIRPEESVGYDSLPTTVTHLFDADPVALSLADVVNMTLANERGLKIQGYELRIAEYQVPVSKGIYDLIAGAGYTFTRIEQQISPVGFVAQPVDSQRLRQGYFSLSQLLPTGATVSLAYNVVRRTNLFTAFDEMFNRSFQTDVRYQQIASLAIRQPLLKGFGPTVTNAGIRIAQYEHEGAAADFQTNVEQTLLDTLATYWELIGAIENYKVRVIAYSAARDLLRINTAKFDAGVLPQTDVLQARAAAESRREEIIRARQSVRDIEDDLKRRVFLQSGRPLWDAQILPSQPIAWREVDPDQETTISTAMAERSELRRARANIKQADVARRVAENARLPELNIVGDVESNGLDTNFDRSWDVYADGKFISYNVGVEAIYPLQNRAARYRLLQAEARSQQAGESLLQLQDLIVLEVRQAIRAVRTARDRIEVTQSTVASEEEKLRSEMKRYDVGISTAFEVLTFQDDLANAQSQHIGAVIDYNVAALRLERARGALLATYGVEVVEAELRPLHKSLLFPVGAN
jgi:outer membrane protein TolC